MLAGPFSGRLARRPWGQGPVHRGRRVSGRRGRGRSGEPRGARRPPAYMSGPRREAPGAGAPAQDCRPESSRGRQSSFSNSGSSLYYVLDLTSFFTQLRKTVGEKYDFTSSFRPGRWGARRAGPGMSPRPPAPSAPLPPAAASGGRGFPGRGLASRLSCPLGAVGEAAARLVRGPLRRMQDPHLETTHMMKFNAPGRVHSDLIMF